MSAPTRPGAPRSSSRTTRRSDARAPRGSASTAGRVPKPQSRPGGPSGPGRATPAAGPRIDPSKPRGSWTAMLTWRTAVLLGVVALAFAVVMPSLRAYLDQQATLETLRAEAAEARTEVEDLQAEEARWDDPSFVVALARERLAYVFPGETPYRVVDPESAQGHAAGSPAAERAPESLAGASWYDRLWQSVVVAGEGETEPATPVEPSPAPVVEESPAEGEQLTDVDFGG